jgi:hypothetical protein
MSHLDIGGPMKRFAFGTIVSAVLVAPIFGAPRTQFDYYLTGSGADALGDTTFGRRDARPEEPRGIVRRVRTPGH